MAGIAVVIQLVSADEALLGEVADAVASSEVSMSKPAPIEDAASLNLDLSVTDVTAIWDAMVAVGQLAGAVHVVQAVVDLVARRRKQSAVTTTVEVVVNGATVTFSGDMSPDEATQRIERFRELAASALDAT